VAAALMTVAEALARVLADAEPLPAETAPLGEAYGRVLAADLKALRMQPPADVSAMDGYAVRAADVASAAARLKLIGEVAAGHPFDGKVGAGEAARIFTGGVVPPGADTIVIQENTTRAPARAGIFARPASISRLVRRCSPKAATSATATLRSPRP
jgi:molybdopterin molybdotransferase